ncbi:HEAT repeat domain-containing protein [Natronorubrum sulfidifaciens]|uniref:PBS lyase HEAT domain-containing protein repeat-containing protein n=1 Tax=Natronorubrum sulfidifaciens JCM 14089 TaxID=1230460 RepID=L9VZE5_9EURY|nr:HEAT repeat domain-containing protein [Natronorubrum sulfidifaciens]ELY42426.1 hypothetical protein C495_15517 [Natronorubrum sulfidifaciens JCM 14089]
MDGQGGETIQQRRTEGDAFELPSVLAQLDTDDPAEQRAAVETIHDTLTERPAACIPTVPKLRGLLEQPSFEDHERVAYCLAELAAESPSDVAPSADELVSFAVDNPTEPATRELCRGLETLAAEHPVALVDHVESIAEIGDQQPADNWETRANAAVALSHIAAEAPGAIEPVQESLLALLADDHERVRASACAALGHGDCEGVTDQLAARASSDPSSTVREQADWALAELSSDD